MPTTAPDAAALVARAEAVLARVEALLPPPVPDPDWGTVVAARWRKRGFHGFLQPVLHPQTIALDDLVAIDEQKKTIDQNTRQFVAGLPDGYQTMVGEQGARLSGGERQRLAIARAIIKDAPILILDEATANLDVTTERDLMGSLAPFMRGRTTIVISHRASVAATADRTVTLVDGRMTT